MKQLDWHERPRRELLRLAWPIMASTVSFSMMTLADTIIMGHVGRPQLAGVGLAGTVTFALLCFSIGLMMGGKALISQAVGARRFEEARRCYGAAVLAALALGAVTTVVGQLAADVVASFTSSPAAGDAAHTYLRIRTLAAPAALLFVALRESSYAHGASRAPMVASIIANVVNVGLALLFVLELEAGPAGAAWATVISHIVEAAVLAGAMLAHRLRPAWPRRAHFAALWRIGWPSGAQFTLEMGSFAILSTLISIMSEADMAAHQIALQVIHFSFMPAVAIGEAASVLAGQAVGANRDPLAMRVAHIALRMAVAYTLAFTVLLALGGGQLVRVFKADPEVARITVRLFHIAAIFQVLDGAQIVARSVLRAVGDVRYAAVVGISAAWVCTPPFAYLLGHRLHLGAAGGWLALLLEILTCAVLLWWRVERRGWAAAAQSARERLARDATETA